jgi:hypothetical protein
MVIHEIMGQSLFVPPNENRGKRNKTKQKPIVMKHEVFYSSLL